MKDSKIRKVLPKALPEGVTAQIRVDGNREFIFILNFKNRKQKIELGGEKFIDMISGKDVKNELKLEANGSTVLERI